MKTINKTATAIFLKLVALANNNNGYIKIDNSKGSFMPLNVEKIGKLEGYKLYSLVHYGKQMGDLMADPEMCFLLAQNKDSTIVIPYSYRNDYMGIDNMDILIENDKLKGIRHKAVASNVKFANTWLKNIQYQQNITL